MNKKSAVVSDLASEANIISQREIEPLLEKAGHITAFYDEAMNCSAAVLDKTGNFATRAYESQMRFCRICRKCFRNTAGAEYPCEKIHHDALAASRRGDGLYIYSCAVGFTYWTSPLYRKGRYVGALIAGQVLSCPPEAALEKFKALCADPDGSAGSAEFSDMLKDIKESSAGEIRAMARIMGICAEEISEKKEDPNDMIRRMIWLEEDPVRTQTKKKSHSGFNWQEDSEYLMEKERLLFAAFRRGDNETGGKILKELMDFILTAIPLDFESIRFRAIELAVLLSRAAIDNTSDSSAFMDANNKHLKRIQDSKTTEELVENLRLVAERMSGKIFSFRGIRHSSVLRRAERYIWENYTRKISLEEIAKASGLSAPYFSTIFKEEMGENLSSYLNRLRVEKAANMLTATGKPLHEITELCGFEDQSWFSKVFKNFTGVSPGKYREIGNKVPISVCNEE
jgi:AraC-like DNA-binding protein/ligand-binding sensor protein